MEIDIEQIIKNYSEFDDFEIERIAKTEAGGIEPEVISILIDEIKKRGLDDNLLKGIEAQIEEIDENDFKKLINRIKELTCPECGRNETPLISCEVCAEKTRKNSVVFNLLLGWWGIPMGIFKTPQAVIKTLTDKKKKNEISDIILTDFVLENVGEIRTYWDDEIELTKFIGHINKHNN